MNLYKRRSRRMVLARRGPRSSAWEEVEPFEAEAEEVTGEIAVTAPDTAVGEVRVSVSTLNDGGSWSAPTHITVAL